MVVKSIMWLIKGGGLPKSAFYQNNTSSDFRFQTYQNLITFNSGGNDGFASYFSGTVQVKIWYNYKLIAQTNPVSILANWRVSN